MSKHSTAKVSETWTLPTYTKQTLQYRRSDLKAAIAREEHRPQSPSGLIHAARRAVAALDEILKDGDR